ncbi:hypothetical protein OAT16_05685 [Prolixibacteraceae bacterium]|nr:hypothetical protein [Prolixibacteraceae bacterium]
MEWFNNSSLCIAFFTVVGTVISAYYIQKQTIRRETKAYIKGIYYWVDISKDKIRSQQRYFEEYLRRIASRDSIGAEFLTHTPQLINKIDGFDFPFLMRLIQINCRKRESPSNIDITYNLINVIKFINTFETEMLQRHSDYLIQIDKIKEHWSEEIKEFYVEYGAYYATVHNNKSSCCSKKALEELYIKMKNGDMLQVDHNRTLIKDMIRIFDKCMSSCSAGTQCPEFHDLTKISIQGHHLLGILEDFDRTQRNMADYIKEGIGQLDELLEIIKELSVIKDLKIRCIFRVV